MILSAVLSKTAGVSCPGCKMAVCLISCADGVTRSVEVLYRITHQIEGFQTIGNLSRFNDIEPV